ncbi:MAG: transcription termination factor Rho, partial [Actinomycetota bacterium]|nr:transcription termination factor Rho [Actinomycetota bacterium]
PADVAASVDPAVADDGPPARNEATPEANGATSATETPASVDAVVVEAEPSGQQAGEQPRDHQPQAPRPREDEGEPGNRRRRRRGRDRERGGPPGGAGGGGAGGEVRDLQGQGRTEEPWTGDPVEIVGLLDLRDEGYGFVRTKGYLASKDDAYVSVKQVRQFGLRKGDHITGATRPAQRNEKNPALLRIDQINGNDPDQARSRPRFEDLTPLFPDEKLRLETPGASNDMTARIVDLVSPIGKGQRGLVVSPPKAGKTTVLKQIVKSIEANNPEVHLMVLLVDERPEEVTDMRRSTGGEVVASTFDRPSEEHTALAELVIERAKRLVEEGRDVVIVLDGITRLARAYNLAAPATGRIMSGGVDSGALYPPKKFFGAARNIEEGGSLTIIATALIETGSKMDEVIFEEFKGTGNMEIRLDRRLAERRIYPAIDVDASSTRHEELLFDRRQLQQVWRVRRALNALSSDGASPSAALERLMDGMRQYKSNEEFLAEAAKAGAATA